MFITFVIISFVCIVDVCISFIFITCMHIKFLCVLNFCVYYICIVTFNVCVPFVITCITFVCVTDVCLMRAPVTLEETVSVSVPLLPPSLMSVPLRASPLSGELLPYVVSCGRTVWSSGSF